MEMMLKFSSAGSYLHCLYTRTHARTFNGPLSGTTRVSQYQKDKNNLDFTEATDSQWQWHQLGHMQVCTSLQTDNLASIPPLNFYRPNALPATQPTASKHRRHCLYTTHIIITHSLTHRHTHTHTHTRPFNGHLSRTT